MDLSASDVAITLQLPDGTTKPLRPRALPDFAAWTYDKTLQSGEYRVQYGPPLSASVAYAVNLDAAGDELRSESALTKADLEQLSERLPELQIRSQWKHLDQQPESNISRRSGVQYTLLLVALGLALSETVLAWWIGRGR